MQCCRLPQTKKGVWVCVFVLSNLSMLGSKFTLYQNNQTGLSPCAAPESSYVIQV